MTIGDLAPKLFNNQKLPQNPPPINTKAEKANAMTRLIAASLDERQSVDGDGRVPVEIFATLMVCSGHAPWIIIDVTAAHKHPMVIARLSPTRASRSTSR